MRPRIFIGSSRKAAPYANAILAVLEKVAECAPWDLGTFKLGEFTLDGLIRQLQRSDFGVL
ncbi:TIR domain-containing protein [Tunturiibacter gelidoferens]|uniref:TIR domain-containing protein n=1 Tax=Tunturiibacter gelidiferens TaxID=3069689 RepID=UPI001C846CDF